MRVLLLGIGMSFVAACALGFGGGDGWDVEAVGSVRVDLEETYGKTASQIVGMGQEAWYRFFLEQAGSETTLTMSAAMSLFGQARQEFNDGMLARRPLEDQRRWTYLRAVMGDFYTQTVVVASVRSGGGTMWNLVHAGRRGAVEAVVGEVLRPTGSAKRGSQSEVWEVLRQARDSFEAMRGERGPDSLLRDGGLGEGDVAMRRAWSAWSEALKVSGELSAAQKGWVFRFFADRGRTMLGEEG